MKRKVMIAISSVAVAAVLGFGIYHSNAAQAEPELSKAEIEKLVNAQYPGTITDGPNLDKGFNKAIYEVEVEGNGKKYEIELDGNTGEILKLEEKEMKVASNNGTDVTNKEKNDDNADDKNKSAEDQNNVDGKNGKSSEQPQKDDSSKQEQKDDSKQNNSKKDSTKKVVIDTEAAKKIALNEFSGTVKELELNEDDGRLIYEIEIKGTNGEAELEVDAYTGEIIYISIDSEIGTSNGNNGAPSGNSGDSDDDDDDDDGDDDDSDDDNDDDDD